MCCSAFGGAAHALPSYPGEGGIFAAMTMVLPPTQGSIYKNDNYQHQGESGAGFIIGSLDPAAQILASFGVTYPWELLRQDRLERGGG